MEKYTFEMDKDTKDRIENFIKAYDLDVRVNGIRQNRQEEKEWTQDGDTCYAISGSGVIKYTRWSSITLSCIQVAEMGNCFKSEEEAEFERDRLKVIAKMKKFAEPEDREWDGHKKHWAIYCSNVPSKSIFYVHFNTQKSNCIYFETKRKAEKCVETIGEDKIKKYYLRLKE